MELETESTTPIWPMENTTISDVTLAPVGIVPHLPTYILVLAMASSLLSIMGCLAILVVFCKFSDLRTTCKRLLMYLTIADLLTASGNLLGIIRYIVVHYNMEHHSVDQCLESGPVCKVQSFITTSSSLMSFLWMMVISTYHHISVRTGDNTRVAERAMFASHLVCWLLPVVIVTFAASYNLLGEDHSLTSGSWCWLTQCPDRYDTPANLLDQTGWMLLTGKAFEIVCYLSLVINYGAVKWILIKRVFYPIPARPPTQINQYTVHGTFGRQHNPGRPGLFDHLDDDSFSDDGHERQPLVQRPIQPSERLDPGDVMFIYLPFIMLVLRAWGTIKFLVLAGLGSDYIINHLHSLELVLTLLQGIGDSGQGWMNFLLFCVLTEEVKDRIVETWFVRPAPSRNVRDVQNQSC